MPPEEESADRQSIQPGLSFGEANGMLYHPQSTQPSLQRSQSSTSAGRLVRSQPPPPPSLITRQSSSTETGTPSSSEANLQKLTPREIEQEMKQAMIPSSKSPSPMKIPNINASPSRKALQRQGTRTLSVSPTKLTREASKALRDNITSLLGKRQPLTGEDQEAMNLRAGKRPRPQRSKQPSRKSSKVQLADIPPVPLPAPVFGDTFEMYDDDDMNLLERSNVGEESMRVTYVDPGQRDEKKRLMSLLRGDNVLEVGEGGKTPSLRTRRSSRIAGF